MKTTLKINKKKQEKMTNLKAHNNKQANKKQQPQNKKQAKQRKEVKIIKIK